MRNDSLEDDPRAVWQEQPTERTEMTIEKIRTKGRELKAKTRRQLLGSLAAPVVAAGFYGFGMKEFPALLPLFAIGIAWSLAGLYFLNRGIWPGAVPGDAALSAGIELYRGEIERRRDLLRRGLLWSFAPILLVIGTFILALGKIGGDRGIFPKALPFLILVFVWIAAYFVIRVREQRELQREIERLDFISSRENRQ